MKPSPFSETLAHPGDLLSNHLMRVAREAGGAFGDQANDLRLAAVLSGLGHDVGKATTYFQNDRLQRGRKTSKTAHSPVSAILCWWWTRDLDLGCRRKTLQTRLHCLAAILRHHGNLEDGPLDLLQRLRRQAADNSGLYLELLASMDLAGFYAWMKQMVRRWNLPLRPPSSAPKPAEILDQLHRPNLLQIQLQIKQADDDSRLQSAVGFLAVYGALLAADKIDTALEGSGIRRVRVPGDVVARYREVKFAAGSSPSALNSVRDRIARHIRECIEIHKDRHLFTLTAPTGSGKTLAVLDAGLHLRRVLSEEGGAPPRIIYCLPFTSIIDQNHQVFADVLAVSRIPRADNILLKHHHLSLPEYREAGGPDGLFTEYEADGAGQLLTETWQSEIVVTTFHQLLHTLLTNKNRELKRCAQLAGAVVILDEVQAVPLRYWDAIGETFRAAAEVLDTRFILMTATQPLIYGERTEVVELLPEHRDYFSTLSRVTVHCRHRQPRDLVSFASELAAEFNRKPTPTLVIVNRKKAVKHLYQELVRALSKTCVLALSTDLTPLDRRRRIAEIQERQRAGEPCIVVSTQLVEAGVDISFPVVHRDLAPFDSIVQSCGRCNRHQETGRGRVYLWQLAEFKESQASCEPLWKRVYDSNLVEVTRDLLAGREEVREEEFLELARDYFRLCRARGGQDRVDRLVAEGKFEQLEKEFQLIVDNRPTLTLFVVQDEADEDLWQRYLDLDEIDDPEARRRAFMEFKFEFLERTIQVYRPDTVLDHAIVMVRSRDGSYNPQTGFVKLAAEEGDSWNII